MHDPVLIVKIHRLSVAGMNMSPVSRLKKTWGKVKTAKFFILEVNTIELFTG